MNLKMTAGKLWAAIKRKSPEILTGLGISSMIGGTVAAVKATPKAMRRIEEKKKELHKKKLTVVETVQATWKCYIPTAVLTATGAGCMIAATAEGNKREAALIALNAFTESKFANYQDAAKDIYGEKGDVKIRDRAVELEMEKNPPSETAYEAYDTNIESGVVPVYFNFPGIPDELKRFECKLKDITDAECKCNRLMATSVEPYMSLYDFLCEIPGIPISKLTKHSYILQRLGWNIYRNFIKVSKPVPKHEPCMYLTTNTQGSAITNYIEFERDGAPDYDYQH